MYVVCSWNGILISPFLMNEPFNGSGLLKVKIDQKEDLKKNLVGAKNQGTLSKLMGKTRFG